MQDLKRRQANWIYFIVAWGLLAGSGIVSVLSVFAPEFVEKYVLQLSSVMTLLVIMLPTMIYISTNSGQEFAKRFQLRSIKSSTLLVIPMAVAGFFAFTGLNGLITAGAAMLGFKSANSAAQTMGSASSAAALLLMGSLLPGIIEESFFRGVLLPAYEDKGAVRAVLISAVLFATLHGDPIALFAQFGLGVLLGYIALRTRSVYPGMIYHAIHNGITFAVLLIESSAVSGNYEEALAQSLAQENLPILMISSAAMMIAGAIALAVCIIIFHIQTKNELKKAKEAEMFAPMEFVDAPKKVRLVYLPLILGIIGAVIINVLGAISLGIAA